MSYKSDLHPKWKQVLKKVFIKDIGDTIWETSNDWQGGHYKKSFGKFSILRHGPAFLAAPRHLVASRWNTNSKIGSSYDPHRNDERSSHENAVSKAIIGGFWA